MISVCKVAQSLKYIECLYPVSRVVINSIRNEYKNVHTSKIMGVKKFVERENIYAYNIMVNKGYAVRLKSECQVVLITKDKFNQLIQEDWSKKTHQELFKLLPDLGAYCSEHGLCISNELFDSYIDNLTDNIKHASDGELIALFHSLAQWPKTESITTRNFKEVWTALDDECLKRHRNWSVDQILSYMSLFYLLNATRVSKYTGKGLQTITDNVQQITPGQLVQMMFFINSNRRAPDNMHSLEICLENNFSNFSIDELCVMSMGFFKSQNPIKSMALLEKIIDKIIMHSCDVHDISLAALLKVIRYSMASDVNNKIYRLLDVLQHEVPRLCMSTIVHLALLGTTTRTLHKDCLSKIAESVINATSEARLKELERLIFTFGTFNYRPDTKECFFQKVTDELRKMERQPELNKYGRSFVSAVAYLGMLNIYPVDLMDKILSPEFLLNTYGKFYKDYGPEVLVIQNFSDIYCTGTKMHRLTTKQITILKAKYRDNGPSANLRNCKPYNAWERRFLDIMRILRIKRGRDCVTSDFVVTHHQRADIIVCNSQDGRPLPVADSFRTSSFDAVRKPPDDNQWIVIVVAGRNSEIDNLGTPTGLVLSKLRDLRALGYHAALVPWSEYKSLKSPEEKAYYLNELIIDSLKSKV